MEVRLLTERLLLLRITRTEMLVHGSYTTNNAVESKQRLVKDLCFKQPAVVSVSEVCVH